MALIALGTSVAACAGGQPPGGAEPCEASQRSARDRTLKVVEANQECATDADCSIVPVHATCFDVCFRAVNAAGKGAVDRVETLLEAADCDTFHEHGCKLEVPACGPPPPSARCEAGRCAIGA